MQRYTVYLYLETAVYIWGGTCTHHQEHTQLYLQHLVLVKPLLLPATNVPDDGWRYNPKHVEQFPGINKLCNVASCWMYIEHPARCADRWKLKKIFITLFANRIT